MRNIKINQEGATRNLFLRFISYRGFGEHAEALLQTGAKRRALHKHFHPHERCSLGALGHVSHGDGNLLRRGRKVSATVTLRS